MQDFYHWLDDNELVEEGFGKILRKVPGLKRAGLAVANWLDPIKTVEPVDEPAQPEPKVQQSATGAPNTAPLKGVTPTTRQQPAEEPLVPPSTQQTAPETPQPQSPTVSQEKPTEPEVASGEQKGNRVNPTHFINKLNELGDKDKIMDMLNSSNLKKRLGNDWNKADLRKLFHSLFYLHDIEPTEIYDFNPNLKYAIYNWLENNMPEKIRKFKRYARLSF